MEDYEKFQAIINNFAENHKKYGYGYTSLEMPSDRRAIRYHELVKDFTFFTDKDERFTILDLGCGYGDIISYLEYIGCNDYEYYGVDACAPFIEWDKKQFIGRDNLHFMLMDYYKQNKFPFEFDYAVSSQNFNQIMTDGSNNMELIQDVIGRAFDQCRKGVSFNFVTDRVQFKKHDVAYHSIMDIIMFAYSKTNSVILDNACMPFEATCVMLKDKATDGLAFDMFRKKHIKEFEDGIFMVIPKKI